MASHFTVDSAHMLREGDSVVDNHTPARGILDMFSGLGLAQDLVEGQGCAIASRGLQQDLVPGRGRYTYPGGRGMGCDYYIIVHLEKFSHISLKIASFNCKFRQNSTEVAKWVIVILCGPRACTRSCAALGRKCLVQRAGLGGDGAHVHAPQALRRHRRLGETPKCAG